MARLGIGILIVLFAVALVVMCIVVLLEHPNSLLSIYKTSGAAVRLVDDGNS